MTTTKRTIITMTMATAGIMTASLAIAQTDGPPDEVTTWVFQPAFDSSDAGWDNGLIPWIEAVEEATEGTVKIDLRPAGSLTSSDEAFMAAASGMTDGYAGWATVYGGDLPEGMLAFGLPMGAESPEQAWEVMWGDDYRVGDLVQEAANERGLHWIGWTDQGTNAMFTNFRVEKLEDLEGKKMRAGGPQALFHEALGGTAVSMGPGDIYTSIRLGAIDGTYWDTGGIDDMSFTEVVDYAIQPGWNPAQHQETFVNLEAWNALTDWQREKIEGVFEETYFETSEMHANQVDIALQALRDEGGEVIDFSDKEIDRMREFSIENVWPKISEMSDRNAKGVEIFKRFMEDKGNI